METARVEICGLFVDSITFQTALSTIEQAVRARRSGARSRPFTVFSANADMVAKASRDCRFAEELNSADLLIADGMPLLWLARLLGTPLPERVTGSDLVPLLAERAAKCGISLFLLGSAPGVAARAGELLTERYPGLRIAGTLAPPLHFERCPSERERVHSLVAAARPDVVLVGLGAPRQERWILSECDHSPVGVFMAIGGTLDMITNGRRRAPRLFQRAGMEWLWRMAQEPRRLGKRYLIEDAPLLSLGARMLWRNARGGRRLGR